MSCRGAGKAEGGAAKLFVICAAASIERSDARAFSLFRIDESGNSRPFSIVVARTHTDDYVGYVNACPHRGIWLNVGEGGFFTRDRGFLKCGRHGAIFEVESGLCIAGPCKDSSLEPIALAVIDGEVCLCGIELEEGGHPDPFDDDDETMEITIHPG